MKNLISISMTLFLVCAAGCESETESRLERIERQNREIQDLYEKKAREIREQLEEGEAANPAQDFKRALDQAEANKRRIDRLEGWLTRTEVIQETGLSEAEIDRMVLRGRLKSVRRPDLEVLYDPTDVQNLKNKKEQESPATNGREQP